MEKTGTPSPHATAMRKEKRQAAAEMGIDDAFVSELVEQRGGDVEDAFAALMHDAAEAYLGDMPHPIKHRSPLGEVFKRAEDHLESVLRERFAIKADVPDVKRVDRALLATERRALSGVAWDWPELEGVEALDVELVPCPPDEAERQFLARFAALQARRR